MRAFAILVLFACSAAAQPPNIVCLFGTYNSATSPKWSGGMSFGSRVSTGLYSYSSVDFTRSSKGVLGTATRTGVAALFRQYGQVSIFALGTGGVATTSTATTGSFSGGGLITYQIKEKPWVVLADFQQSTEGKTVRAGIGYTWGK